MKNFIGLLLFSIVGITSLHAQDLDAAKAKEIITAQNYRFIARSASPSRGGVRQLTSDYDLTVMKDSVIAWLPYFGRAYSAPINSEGGIKFTSVDFVYTMQKEKKHSWEIVIKPKDASDVGSLNLTIFDNGNANLRVNSINRESISFNGYIVEGKPLDKKAF